MRPPLGSNTNVLDDTATLTLVFACASSESDESVDTDESDESDESVESDETGEACESDEADETDEACETVPVRRKAIRPALAHDTGREATATPDSVTTVPIHGSPAESVTGRRDVAST